MIRSIALVLMLTLRAVSTSEPQFIVAAYLPEWRYEGANWEVIMKSVTHLILFSLEISADGAISALDRIPRPMLLNEARAAAIKNNAELLICFGGNGRSEGFRSMVRSALKRQRFIKALVKLCIEYEFNGVDYNWEYPGYQLGRGYMPDSDVEADYKGLALLVRETNAAFRVRSIK